MTGQSLLHDFFWILRLPLFQPKNFLNETFFSWHNASRAISGAVLWASSACPLDCAHMLLVVSKRLSGGFGQVRYFFPYQTSSLWKKRKLLWKNQWSGWGELDDRVCIERWVQRAGNKGLSWESGEHSAVGASRSRWPIPFKTQNWSTHRPIQRQKGFFRVGNWFY